jgi:hypothetical protein
LFFISNTIACDFNPLFTPSVVSTAAAQQNYSQVRYRLCTR